MGWGTGEICCGDGVGMGTVFTGPGGNEGSVSVLMQTSILDIGLGAEDRRR